MVDHFPSFFIAGAWGYHSLIQKRSPILKPTVEAIVWRFAMWLRVFFEQLGHPVNLMESLASQV
jgi:hypothetical protein